MVTPEIHEEIVERLKTDDAFRHSINYLYIMLEDKIQRALMEEHNKLKTNKKEWRRRKHVESIK